jgi:hypothetical protein
MLPSPICNVRMRAILRTARKVFKGINGQTSIRIQYNPGLFRLWETAAQCLRSHTKVGLKLKARSSRQAETPKDTPFVQQRCVLDLQRSACNPQWSHAQPIPLSTLNSWEHGNYPSPLIVRGDLRLMSYSKHMWQQKISYRNDPVQVFPWNNTYHHTITFASLLHPSASIQHWHFTVWQHWMIGNFIATGIAHVIPSQIVRGVRQCAPIQHIPNSLFYSCTVTTFTVL